MIAVDPRIDCYASMFSGTLLPAVPLYQVTDKTMCNRMAELNSSPLELEDASRQVSACFLDYARYKNDTKECESISDPDIKYWCQQNLGTQPDPLANPAYYNLSSTTIASLRNVGPYDNYISILGTIDHSKYDFSGYTDVSFLHGRISYPPNYRITFDNNNFSLIFQTKILKCQI